jgi:hypothetical protein
MRVKVEVANFKFVTWRCEQIREAPDPTGTSKMREGVSGVIVEAYSAYATDVTHKSGHVPTDAVLSLNLLCGLRPERELSLVYPTG